MPILSFQTYLLDNPFIRKKFKVAASKCFPVSEDKFVKLEREMLEEGPQWPPVSPSPSNMVNRYKRLDSVQSATGVEESKVIYCIQGNFGPHFILPFSPCDLSSNLKLDEQNYIQRIL